MTQLIFTCSKSTVFIVDFEQVILAGNPPAFSYLKSTMETLKQYVKSVQRLKHTRSIVFIANFEQISHINLVLI